MATGGPKGMASSQGGNEVTGAFQTGGSVEQTKLNTPGVFWQTELVHVLPTETRQHACACKDIRLLVLCLVAQQRCEIDVMYTNGCCVQLAV